MHRSGTSLIASILYKIGFFMGEELLGKNISNPLGHFEDQNLIDLNDQILSAAGGTWYDPPERGAILNQSGKFQQEIVSSVAAMPSGLWGWKDPRLCLTIELFLPYLDTPVFIICRREPSSIAESLYRRNRIDYKQGLSVVDIYQKRIDLFLEKYPDHRRMIIRYEEICSNPDQAVRQIIDFLKLEIQPKIFREAVKSVVSRTRIHRMERRIERNDLIKTAFFQFFKNPKVFFIKLKNYLT